MSFFFFFFQNFCKKRMLLPFQFRGGEAAASKRSWSWGWGWGNPQPVRYKGKKGGDNKGGGGGISKKDKKDKKDKRKERRRSSRESRESPRNSLSKGSAAAAAAAAVGDAANGSVTHDNVPPMGALGVMQGMQQQLSARQGLIGSSPTRWSPLLYLKQMLTCKMLQAGKVKSWRQTPGKPEVMYTNGDTTNSQSAT